MVVPAEMLTVEDPEIDPIVAVMTLDPVATAVTTPVEAFTVAFAGAALVQTGDTHTLVDESEYVAAQIIARVDPMDVSEPGFGVTAMDTRLGELEVCSNAPMVGAVRLRTFPG